MAFGKRWGELRIRERHDATDASMLSGRCRRDKRSSSAGHWNVDQEGGDLRRFRRVSLKGHVDAARVLLDAGAAVDKRREGDWSPFGIACALGHVDVATLLVERGAAVDLRCSPTDAFCGGEPVPPRLLFSTLAGNRISTKSILMLSLTATLARLVM